MCFLAAFYLWVVCTLRPTCLPWPLTSADLEVTVDFLKEIDKLVQLIESPIFACQFVSVFLFWVGGFLLLLLLWVFFFFGGGGVAGGCWMVLKEEVTSHQVFYSVTSLYQSGSCISSSRCWFWWGGLSGGVLLLRLWPRIEPECPYCWTILLTITLQVCSSTVLLPLGKLTAVCGPDNFCLFMLLGGAPFVFVKVM